MFRYKLRTLLIVLAIGPPLLAAAWFGYVATMRHCSERSDFEWGGVIVLDDLEPIYVEELSEAIRETVSD
jgi:hypothetical protein